MQGLPGISGDGTSIAAILQAVDDARRLRPDVPLALATLVNVEGSSYRQPGARLLVDAESRVLAGAISGGCLEGDVGARAHSVCTLRQSVLLRYDLREDLETIWGFGAACDGIAYVLLESLHDDAWLRDALAAMWERTNPVLITRFETHAGEGNNEDRSIAPGDSHTLVTDKSDTNLTLVPYVLAALAGGHPMVCVDPGAAGTTRLLVEPLWAPIALHIIGAGRSAEAFATIACAMGWQVTVIDHREALLHELRLPAAANRMLRRTGQGLEPLPLDGRTAIAILTHIFQIDADWLSELLVRPVAYIGVLGSRNRAARLLDHLTHDDIAVTKEMQGRLFAPLGLDLGGESPESIALAGIAEMEAVLHQRPGGFLRSRQSPIHTRTPIPTAALHATDVKIERCAVDAGADFKFDVSAHADIDVGVK